MARLRLKPNAPRLKDYLKVVQNIQGLSQTEEGEYVRRLKAGDEVSKRALIEAFLPMVVKWVAPLRGGHLTFASMIEAGNIAMIRALKDYAAQAEGSLAAFLEAAVTAEILRRNAGPAQGRI